MEIGKIWGFNVISINNTQEVGYPEESDIRGPPVLRYDFKKESWVPVFYSLSIKQELFTLNTVWYTLIKYKNTCLSSCLW